MIIRYINVLLIIIIITNLHSASASEPVGVSSQNCYNENR